MSEKEVGRWPCQKCGREIVATGRGSAAFTGIGSFSGPCPWECGAWINRGFRGVRPGFLRMHRAAEWDGRTASAP